MRPHFRGRPIEREMPGPVNLQKIMIPPNAKMTKPTKGSRSSEPASKRPIKVALVEDQPKVRESWTKLINSFPDFVCICACNTGEEALRIIPDRKRTRLNSSDLVISYA